MYTSDAINIYQLYAESSRPFDSHTSVQRNERALKRIENIDGKKVIRGDVSVVRSGIETLHFDGVHVMGNFMCSYNRISSLQGAPASVSGGFSCDNNLLTSLVGAPSAVEMFSCENNPHLRSLDHVHIVTKTFVFGAPITINQVANSDIHAQKFKMYVNYEYKDVTDQVDEERSYKRTLTSELSGVEDAINITDIDF